MLESLSDLTDYITDFQENKQDYTSLPTRSKRNVLNDVFSINELLKKKLIL